MPDHRIISLIASATEVVCALGFEDRLVGRSHECDWPPSVRRLPQCSEPRIDVEGTSREIDDRVKATVENALSVYRVHADVLEQLRPTVIVTQTHCEVCAVSLKDVEEAVCRLVSTRPRIVSLEPNALADLWTGIRNVAAALDASERAEPLIERLRGRLDALSTQTARLAERPTIGCIEWIDPLMSVGNWMPELVEIAGGGDLFGQAGRHSPWMSWEELVEKDPDVIALMPCGFDIDRTRREFPALVGRPDWPSLRAVRQGRV
jgi:iron complex transport system substrate-binding protein